MIFTSIPQDENQETGYLYVGKFSYIHFTTNKCVYSVQIVRGQTSKCMYVHTYHLEYVAQMP